MVILTSEPVTTIAGKPSRWNAAFNPLKFTFQQEAGDTRTNLRIEVVITSGTRSIPGYFSAGPNGTINVNVFSLIKSLIRPVDKFNHVSTNYIDRNLFAPFTVKYREEWEDAERVTQNSEWVTLKNTYYVTYSAMQLGEKFGGNMAEYVTFNGGSSAKFLTEFKEPKAWQGLPYDIAFILYENLIFKKVYFKYTPVDINGNPVEGGIKIYYLLTEEGGKFLNEEGEGGMLLEESEIPALLESTVTDQNSLPQDVGVVRLRIPEVLATAYKVKLEVFYIENNESVKVTEDKFIQISTPCSDPYVYLKWMNHLGAWDYFRFGYNQIIVSDVRNEQMVSRVVSDWENSDTIADVVKKAAVDKITVGAHGLTPDQMQGLTWLRRGIKAQMLVSVNPVKWQTVIVQSGSDSRDSRARSGNVKLTIELPEANIQNQ
ncbi:hypothetical protein [Pedobacter sp. SYSU D00535]|uniref:hypothetical protein n=1 Tax=Pedobacter sp. SYSU D00535 TaxID=2810308 RepID=UPI001A966F5C|nr:hypothetical protein [Pedobacter sp. SYSU D00535]